MPQTFEAVYDGSVLHPMEHIELQPNTRVRITIELMDADLSSGASFLRTARSLKLDGPEDWSSRLDTYLYESGANDRP